jgi:hypothetical protein
MLARLKFKLDNLVNDILSHIPDDVIINGTILDPAMGGGQFVKEIERRKRAAGKTDEEIRKTVFGIESNILRRNYAVNKHKLVGDYQVGNALTMDFNGMKFDVVIGNPPYQSNKGTGTQPLWSLFVNAAYNILSDNGTMAFIIPNKWCGHTTNVIKGNIHLYSDIFNGKLTYCNIQKCSEYFPNVGSYENSFSYFVLDNKGSSSFKVETPNNIYTVNKDQFKYLPLRDFTSEAANILAKIKTSSSYEFKQVSVNFKNKNNKSIVISMAQRLHYDKLNIYYDKNTTYNATSKSTVSRKLFDNSSQDKIDGIFRSKLFRYIHWLYWNGDNFGTTFYNSLPYLDANNLWSDNDIYTHFKLTQEEISHIETIIS